MSHASRATGRVFAAWLIVLALSPLTAPFSTIDLIALLDERPHAGVILHSKNAPHASAADIQGSAWEPGPLTRVTAPRPCAVAVTGSRRLQLIPLRI